MSILRVTSQPKMAAGTSTISSTMQSGGEKQGRRANRTPLPLPFKNAPRSSAQQLLQVSYHWLEPSHMTTSSCKGGREVSLSGCRGHICKEEAGSQVQERQPVIPAARRFQRLHEEPGSGVIFSWKMPESCRRKQCRIPRRDAHRELCLGELGEEAWRAGFQSVTQTHPWEPHKLPSTCGGHISPPTAVEGETIILIVESPRLSEQPLCFILIGHRAHRPHEHTLGYPGPAGLVINELSQQEVQSGPLSWSLVVSVSPTASAGIQARAKCS